MNVVLTRQVIQTRFLLQNLSHILFIQFIPLNFAFISIILIIALVSLCKIIQFYIYCLLCYVYHKYISIKNFDKENNHIIIAYNLADDDTYARWACKWTYQFDPSITREHKSESTLKTTYVHTRKIATPSPTSDPHQERPFDYHK